jgi:hypothetical protein
VTNVSLKQSLHHSYVHVQNDTAKPDPGSLAPSKSSQTPSVPAAHLVQSIIFPFLKSRPNLLTHITNSPQTKPPLRRESKSIPLHTVPTKNPKNEEVYHNEEDQKPQKKSQQPRPKFQTHFLNTPSPCPSSNNPSHPSIQKTRLSVMPPNSPLQLVRHTKGIELLITKKDEHRRIIIWPTTNRPFRHHPRHPLPQP